MLPLNAHDSRCCNPCTSPHACVHSWAFTCTLAHASAGVLWIPRVGHGSNVCACVSLASPGAIQGLNSSACSGPCAAGRYGSLRALTLPECEGNCSAGYYCPPGSTSPSNPSYTCFPGTYSLGGAAVCSSCPAGRFGTSVGMTTALCTDVCPGGEWLAVKDCS